MGDDEAVRQCGSGDAIFQSLHGRLAYVVFVARQTITTLYEQFLLDEKAIESPLWEAYQIHVFFNMFLYTPDSPGFGQSKFDFIVFGNNLSELILFLAETRKISLSFDIPDVA